MSLEEFEKLKKENVFNFIEKKYVPDPEDWQLRGNYELVVDVGAVEKLFNTEIDVLETTRGNRVCRLNLNNASVAAES